MYKLIATTALVAITASSASAWDGDKELINSLHAIYTSTNLGTTGTEGTKAFNALQGAGGELEAFFGAASGGVAHVTLQVGADNQITPIFNGGAGAGSIGGIQEKATALVLKVNQDLFGQDTAQNKPSLPYDETNGKPGTITPGENGGLFGAKINEVVGYANGINQDLIDGNTDPLITQAEFDKGVLSGNANVAGVFTSTTSLNTGIVAANGVDDGNGNFAFFGGLTGIGGEGITDVNAYTITGFKSATEINDGTNTYSSLLNWATNTPD